MPESPTSEPAPGAPAQDAGSAKPKSNIVAQYKERVDDGYARRYVNARFWRGMLTPRRSSVFIVLVGLTIAAVGQWMLGGPLPRFGSAALAFVFVSCAVSLPIFVHIRTSQSQLRTMPIGSIRASAFSENSMMLVTATRASQRKPMYPFARFSQMTIGRNTIVLDKIEGGQVLVERDLMPGDRADWVQAHIAAARAASGTGYSRPSTGRPIYYENRYEVPEGAPRRWTGPALRMMLFGSAGRAVEFVAEVIVLIGAILELVVDRSAPAWTWGVLALAAAFAVIQRTVIASRAARRRFDARLRPGDLWQSTLTQTGIRLRVAGLPLHIAHSSIDRIRRVGRFQFVWLKGAATWIQLPIELLPAERLDSAGPHPADVSRATII